MNMMHKVLVKLGIWIHNQRMAYKGQGTNKITEEQIKLLEEIGMRFDNVNANFERWMKLIMNIMGV